jgi:uncharacterized protein (TIGR02246 family)
VLGFGTIDEEGLMNSFPVASAFRRKIVVAVAAIAVTAAGASAQQKPAGADEAAIGKVRAAYQTAAAAQDAAGMAKLYAPDGIEMPPNAPAVRGRAAIEAFHKAMAKEWMIHGMTITPTETHVTGDRAYETGTYKQGLMPQKGGGMIDDTGKFVVLLKKDASGAWWITHSIYNSDLPLPAAAPAKK